MCRKSPRDYGPKTVGQRGKQYNEEGEDIDTDEENKEEDVEPREEPTGNPKKKQRRKKEEDFHLEGNAGLEIYVLPSLPITPQEIEKDKLVEGRGEVVIKDKRMACENFCLNLKYGDCKRTHESPNPLRKRGKDPNGGSH